MKIIFFHCIFLIIHSGCMAFQGYESLSPRVSSISIFGFFWSFTFTIFESVVIINLFENLT